MRGRGQSLLRQTIGAGRYTRSKTFPSMMPSAMSINNNGVANQRILRKLSLHTSCQFHQYCLNTLSFDQKRWKNSGKIGNEVESLKEMAHRPEREAAVEKRKKKKARKAAKKSGNKKQQNEVSAASDNNDDDVDDLFFDDDDDEDELNEDEEPTLPDLVAVRGKMDTVIDRFENSLKSIRGAEPTADMFDDVIVQAYGASTPLNAVAQVVIASPTMAQLTCFDPTVAKDVVKAVQLTLELNPQLEEGGGGIIKVPLPRVSMEVREKLSKSVKKRAESCKQRLRGVRRKAMDVVKKGKDGKLPGVSKDDAFACGKDIESASEAAAETLNTIVEKKMESIMAV